ncbi:hypothetical protein Pelo_4133 [Pelomyxa schiedti]|nr:hypothetical protein Pelo_4133 [Pelomyxa schiedti]
MIIQFSTFSLLVYYFASGAHYASWEAKTRKIALTSYISANIFFFITLNVLFAMSIYYWFEYPSSSSQSMGSNSTSISEVVEVAPVWLEPLVDSFYGLMFFVLVVVLLCYGIMIRNLHSPNFPPSPTTFTINSLGASSGLSAVSQKLNLVSTVHKLLTQQYGTSHVKVFTWCNENCTLWEPDFNCQTVFCANRQPSLQQIRQFCLELDAWLEGSPLNIAVLHSTGSKGRAGCMVCCYLVHKGISADDAMKEYQKQRTKGLTKACNVRYVHYYEQVVKQHKSFAPVPAPLVLIRIHMAERIEPQVFARVDCGVILLNREVEQQTSYVDVNCGALNLKADVELAFQDRNEYLFSLCLHTTFVDQTMPLYVSSAELDTFDAQSERSKQVLATVRSLELCFSDAKPDSLVIERKSKLKSQIVLNDLDMAPTPTVSPSRSITASWFLKNIGKPWPEGCFVVCVKSPNDAKCPDAPLPCASQGQVVPVSATIRAPKKPGEYATSWVCCEPSGFPNVFGEPLPFSFIVKEKHKHHHHKTTQKVSPNPTPAVLPVIAEKRLSATTPTATVYQSPTPEPVDKRKAVILDDTTSTPALLGDALRVTEENSSLQERVKFMQATLLKLQSENEGLKKQLSLFDL